MSELEQLQERLEQAEEQVQRLSKYLQWMQDYPVDEQGHKQFSWTINKEIMDLLKGVPSGDIAWAREVAQERVRTKLVLERAEQAERALAERNSLIERLRRSLEAAPNPSHMQGYSFKYSRWYWEMRPAALALTPTAAGEHAAAEREVVEAALALKRADDAAQEASSVAEGRAIGEANEHELALAASDVILGMGITPRMYHWLLRGDANPKIGDLGKWLAGMGWQLKMSIEPLEQEGQG